MKAINDNVIKEVVKNNKLAEQLSELEKVVESLYGRFGYTGTRDYERLIYKDSEGNTVDPDEFFTTLLDWIDTNISYLQRQSISVFNN